MGKIKRKGAYEHDVQWHQDCSALIIPKAAEAALVRGEDIRTFIESHKDDYDFMCRAKVPRSNRLVMRWPEYDNAEVECASIIRYYVSNHGGSLHKIAPPTGELGTWKRATRITDTFYSQVITEIRGKGSKDCKNCDGTGRFYGMEDNTCPCVDADDVPWDERIHTKNRSKHDKREMGICVGWRVTDCSNVANFDRSTVNYDYYVQEAEKLVKPLLGE